MVSHTQDGAIDLAAARAEREARAANRNRQLAEHGVALPGTQVQDTELHEFMVDKTKIRILVALPFAYPHERILKQLQPESNGYELIFEHGYFKDYSLQSHIEKNKGAGSPVDIVVAVSDGYVMDRNFQTVITNDALFGKPMVVATASRGSFEQAPDGKHGIMQRVKTVDSGLRENDLPEAVEQFASEIRKSRREALQGNAR